MKKSKNFVLVAGGAGFIGSNLIKILKNKNKNIVILDNLSRGKFEYISGFLSENVIFINNDINNKKELQTIFKKYIFREIWHLAANSDIVSGVKNSSIDLNDTFLTTHNLIECSKLFNVNKFNFASSSAVYGDHGNRLLTEESGPLTPISNYGAMKLASEAILSASSAQVFNEINIFRFPNVVGLPATHGVILDFVNKLVSTKSKLDVLGNGKQKKQYLHVEDLINAMLYINKICKNNKFNIYNIGPKDYGITVSKIAELVRDEINENAKIVYGTNLQGWVGDVPRFRYSTEKLSKLGWTPQYSSLKSVKKAISEIIKSQT